ncbi:hypothetical protein MIT9_P0517 [Methylomarinovum caldicuralii]|uniref:DUF4160 domain-containing protein n=1 Tax=Methylomarinovum caldicuralii TaxID=438856 RepID=A0AAU9C4Y9_9GAMM|nr:DUF4160 domain-containing protein [Methylomarinovum caldicuralii]BCX80939.1 hypothetical protein MIT9_P0517 [Methylomarinovum caldicuralii]
MTPTILQEDGYRYFFFSREEPRMHVHVVCAEGEAKFWLEPQIDLAKNYRLSRRQLKHIEQVIEANYATFVNAWKTHFRNRSDRDH